jgi:hypothetical protein
MFHANVSCSVIQLTLHKGKDIVRVGYYLFHRGLLVPSVPSGAHDVG